MPWSNDIDEKNKRLSGEMTNEDEETVQEDKLMFKDLTWGAPPKKKKTKMKVKRKRKRFTR